MIRALNATWGALSKAGVGLPSLEAESLLGAAMRAADGRKFQDESFRQPFERMLASLEHEARLHPLGRAAMRQTLLRTLGTRLGLEARLETHPEIARIPVEAPVFILGLQRTGTTLLHRLLTCEPTLRPLLSWEAITPVPAAGWRPGAAGERDPRMGTAEFAERALRYIAPEFFAIHPVEAHAPEEDVLLMDASFYSPTVDATFRTPSYSEWFWSVDQKPAYAYLRQLIQLLLWQRPGRYLGKTPHHLANLDALLDVFPDARIIQTHRDPVRVAASYCSMMSHGRLVFSDDIDPFEVGHELSEGAVRSVERAMEVRERRDPGSFLDVAYPDLVERPLVEVRRIYDFIGAELSPDTLRRMEAWLGRNPQNKHGVHRYRLEDFGLDRERLGARFSRYRARYGIAEED